MRTGVGALDKIAFSQCRAFQMGGSCSCHNFITEMTCWKYFGCPPILAAEMQNSKWFLGGNKTNITVKISSLCCHLYLWPLIFVIAHIKYNLPNPEFKSYIWFLFPIQFFQTPKWVAVFETNVILNLYFIRWGLLSLNQCSMGWWLIISQVS